MPDLSVRITDVPITRPYDALRQAMPTYAPQPADATEAPPSDAQARRLANLRPPWKPGESGNPAGRPPYGASFREHVNGMADWSRGDLQSLIERDDTPAVQAAAAQVVMQARDGDGASIDRACDRTIGKPPQTSNVHVEGLDHAGAVAVVQNKLGIFLDQTEGVRQAQSAQTELATENARLRAELDAMTRVSGGFQGALERDASEMTEASNRLPAGG